MGDINLLEMIRKIKNSLSGFVSTSDKASKSKFGIVKVGDNLSVSSGTISVPVATEETYGVVKAGGSGGGIVCDELFSGTIIKGDAFTILHPYTDYVFLQIHIVSGSEGSYDSIISVPGLATGSNNVNTIIIANTQNALRVNPENPTSLLLTGSGTITNAKVYGYK